MNGTVARWLAAGSLVATGLLSACSGTTAAAPSVPAPAAQVTNPPVAAATMDAGGPTPVDCGPVDSPTGQVTLIAEAAEAGTVGCTEAINVISQYYEDAPTKSEGTLHALTIDGWSCSTDTTPGGTGMAGCDHEARGLAFSTRR
jgi:hypothetical protein